MAHGAVLPPLWKRMLTVAATHGAEHGGLLNTSGRLSSWLTHVRQESQSKNLPRRAVSELDRLDPDWRLDRGARQAAAKRRGVVNSHQLASFHQFESRVREARFDDPAAFLRHGIVEHLNFNELGQLVGVRGDNPLRRMRARNPQDPLVATAGMRSSVTGRLADDGQRVQCHECGLWFGRLERHVSGHDDEAGEPLTPESYWRRNGLPEDLTLRSAASSNPK